MDNSQPTSDEQWLDEMRYYDKFNAKMRGDDEFSAEFQAEIDKLIESGEIDHEQ